MEEKKTATTKLKDAITSDDILGKDVIDSEGEFIGIAEQLFIDAKRIEIRGVLIDKGFLKSGLIIGKGYIKEIKSHAIFLKIRPALNIKNKIVFDLDGKYVGKVKDVQLAGNRNKIKNIVVTFGILKRNYIISARYIKNISQNVFLNEKIGKIVYSKIK